MPKTAVYHDRLEALIDDLLAANDLESTSLASLLMTVQEAWRDGSITPLSLLVRRALQARQIDGPGLGESPSPPLPASP